MRNPIDVIVNFFDPKAGLLRAQSRLAHEMVARKYDAASKGRRNNGWWRKNTSAAQEVSAASRTLSATGQELCRNNPLASRMKRVWANNAVGSGIQADVGADGQDSWDNWAESTDCDFEGHYNLYGLQWLWMSTIIESGGVFVRKHVNAALKMPLQLQTIEQDMLDVAKKGADPKGEVIDGVVFDKNGQVKGYYLLTEKTGTGMGKPPESKFHSSDSMIHIYRKERAGQHLGVTWFAENATTFRNYNTYTDAKLMQQQIAACFALIIEEAESRSGVGGDGTSEMPDALEPAMIEYVKNGQTVTTVTPPNADNSSNFDSSVKRDIAMGGGITYEMLTGDYSLVNFASGRMGKTEFFNELDFVQKSMLKPQLNKIFNWFNVIGEIKGGAKARIDQKVDWTFPVRAAVNPKEEFDVLMAKVRHGMMSPSKAAKQLGEKFELIMAQWVKDKSTMGELPFDIDPSMFSSAGNQITDDDAANTNKDAVTGDGEETKEGE